jgi:hypothetical protein
MTKYSTLTTSAKDSTVIKIVDKGQESRYLLGF